MPSDVETKYASLRALRETEPEAEARKLAEALEETKSASAALIASPTWMSSFAALAFAALLSVLRSDPAPDFAPATLRGIRGDVEERDGGGGKEARA